MLLPIIVLLVVAVCTVFSISVGQYVAATSFACVVAVLLIDAICVNKTLNKFTNKVKVLSIELEHKSNLYDQELEQSQYLREHLDDAETSLNNISKDYEEYKKTKHARIMELLQTNDDLAGTNAKVREQLNDAKKAKDTAERKLTELQKQFGDLNQEFVKLKMEHDETIKQNESLANERNDLREQLNNVNDDLLTANDKLIKANDELIAASEELAKFKAKPVKSTKKAKATKASTKKAQ